MADHSAFERSDERIVTPIFSAPQPFEKQAKLADKPATPQVAKAPSKKVVERTI
ncbi:hypothetical protein NKI19_29870 [Mesorhizobium sp. M0751]|uniref:hypothetical protein n=1 Tax=unclassified Mesorhizobium TaxID=325217 RepID=UPI00333C8529